MICIERVEPNSTNLHYFHEYLLASCDKNIDYNDFIKCASSIYIAKDMYRYNTIGIIGCRRLRKEEIDIDKLKYYCKPNGIIYSIDFLHQDSFKYDLCGNYHTSTEVIERLIYECLADKNDAFTVYRPYCPTGKSPECHDSLIKMGFNLESYDNRTDIFTYVCPPKVRAI